jgi:signal transduction histidine kinase
MRIVPRSFAGQLTVLLVLALVIVQGLAYAMFAGERLEAVRQAYRENVIARTYGVLRLLSGTPPALHQHVVSTASTRYLTFSLSEEAGVRDPESDVRSARLAALFARGLGNDASDIRIASRSAPRWSDRHDHERRSWHDRSGRAFEEHDEDEHEYEHEPPETVPDVDDRRGDPPSWLARAVGRMRGLGGPWYAASIRTPDARWLNVTIGPPPGPPPLGVTFLLSLGLSAIAVVVVVVLTVRRLSQPLRRLSDAADRYGRGDPGAGLREEGPEEVRRTTRAFNVMRERLERFVRDRTTMLAAMSHDLRTPLTSLRLQAEFVDDTPTRTWIIATLDEMQSLIEATLAFAREDAHEEPVRPVDLAALVDSVRADLCDLGHDVSTDASGSAVVDGRPDPLKRLFRNLVVNAVTYGARARVQVRNGQEDVTVTVDDDGPGIPEADLERVFDPFVRLEDSRSRSTGGTGLGLAIARGIARRHGGDVMLENRESGGLRATARLPR